MRRARHCFFELYIRGALFGMPKATEYYQARVIEHVIPRNTCNRLWKHTKENQRGPLRSRTMGRAPYQILVGSWRLPDSRTQHHTISRIYQLPAGIWQAAGGPN